MQEKKKPAQAKKEQPQIIRAEQLKPEIIAPMPDQTQKTDKLIPRSAS